MKVHRNLDIILGRSLMLGTAPYSLVFLTEPIGHFPLCQSKNPLMIFYLIRKAQGMGV